MNEAAVRPPTRVLILGASGMLGHALYRELSDVTNLVVQGTAREPESFRGLMPEHLLRTVRFGVDALDQDSVERALDDLHPDVIVNCIGVIKQDPAVDHATSTVRLNALLPHVLAEQCERRDVRLIQISTDCVFSGRTGGYSEADIPDPADFYGRSKLLGEATYGSALTLRTSIVGHELGTSRSLIDWFLSQPGEVQGYTRAVYTGLTTCEFASMLAEVVIPDRGLCGLYHVASEAISKHDLLQLVADAYDWPGTLTPYEDFECDRSLSARKFTERTGYEAPSWPAMIAGMRLAALRWEARS